ncbi:hypothetical protein [Lysobacter enzymogenes]|uniref:hypothetical protein n=1 Tax=Lysobacter enzymogenes TaxID=69 RepID=UPI0019D12614|nr:hypothetical protein [Lysobacter enzymogenes]
MSTSSAGSFSRIDKQPPFGESTRAGKLGIASADSIGRNGLHSFRRGCRIEVGVARESGRPSDQGRARPFTALTAVRGRLALDHRARDPDDSISAQPKRPSAHSSMRYVMKIANSN